MAHRRGIPALKMKFGTCLDPDLACVSSIVGLWRSWEHKSCTDAPEQEGFAQKWELLTRIRVIDTQVIDFEH